MREWMESMSETATKRELPGCKHCKLCVSGICQEERSMLYGRKVRPEGFCDWWTRKPTVKANYGKE
jgi:hypothetical protein